MAQVALLTPRQSSVVELLDRGFTNKEIAAALGISEAGVKAHLSRLLLRYRAPNRVALLRAIALEREDGAGQRDETISGDLLAIGRSIRNMRERGIDIDTQFATLGRMDPESPRFRDVTGKLSAKGTPRAGLAVSELRAALAALELAFELAERLPPEAVRGPLLDVVRRRVRSALAATEEFERALRKAPASRSRPRRAAPRRRR
jgi:DNA-binding CsgD family transcriptional regulator